MQQPPLLLHDVGHEAPLHETPYAPDYEARFQVKPRVRRSFSFEELQSGSCFQSMDEYDLQFYRIYGQPVYIPPADDALDGALGALASLHYPYQQQQASSGSSHRPPPYKSYALAGSLGDPTVHTSTHPANPSHPTHSYAHGSQQPSTASSVHMAYSSNFASDHLAGGTAPAFDPLSVSQYTPINASYVPDSNSTPVPPTVNGTDPLMDHLTFLPSPMQCASPAQEEPGQSTPFGHSPPFQQPPQPLRTSSASVSNGWMDTAPQSHMTVPSQAYPDHPIQDTSKSDYAQTSRHQTKSPSPRTQQARGSMIGQQHQHHGKGRSLDKKPALACLFCRGRKIACGPPLPGSKDKTCNQCARRHLKCEYPLESRRGMRKRRSVVPRAGSATPPSPPSAPATNATSGPKREKSPEGLPPAKYRGRKRSLEKRA